jgi:hypothetical protein
VTGIDAEVVFIRVSFGSSDPDIGPIGEISDTVARFQVNDVDVVALVGV